MQIQEIKLFMKQNGITQIELAEKSKIPLTTIRYIFSGRTQTPRIDTMHAIEKALGISKEQELQIPAEKQELVNLILQMDEESLKEALTILNYVTNK